MTTERQPTHYERINQIRQHIRHHMDEPINRGWLLAEITGVEATLQLPELEFDLPFTELYEGVDWLPD